MENKEKKNKGHLIEDCISEISSDGAKRKELTADSFICPASDDSLRIWQEVRWIIPQCPPSPNSPMLQT